MAFKYNPRLHWALAAIIMAIDIVIVAMTIYTDKVHHTEPPKNGDTDTGATIGWLGVFGAVFIFGNYGIFIKTPSVEKAKVDCMVFQVYYSAAVAATSMIIWFAAGSSEGLTFTGSSFAMGLGFAVAWIILSTLTFNAVQAIGYAAAPAIWMGVTIATSFVWGVAAFGNPVKSWLGAVCALALMLSGVALAAASSSVSDREQGRAAMRQTTGGDRLLVEAPPPPAADSSRPFTKLMMFGVACASLAGVLNGSLMVFMTCFQSGCSSIGVAKYTGSVLAPLAFLPSMAAGIIVAQPVLFLLYWGRSMMTGEFPQFHAKTAAVPALLTGCFWAMGFFNSMYATVYLGQTVGFPLTQTCLVITGSWGILYYKEIQGFKGIAIFVAGAMLILAGAALDGLFC